MKHFRPPATHDFEHKQEMDLHKYYNNKSTYQEISEIITEQCISKYD